MRPFPPMLLAAAPTKQAKREPPAAKTGKNEKKKAGFISPTLVRPAAPAAFASPLSSYLFLFIPRPRR